MKPVCIIVDLESNQLTENWQESLRLEDWPFDVQIVEPDAVKASLELGQIVMMLIFCLKAQTRLTQVLTQFRSKVGAIPAFQAIVCDDPSPQMLAQCFEFGIDSFFNSKTWPEELAAMVRKTASILNDSDAPEAKIISVSQTILSGDQAKIAKAAEELAEVAEYDYLAAYQKGKALEASGQLDAAIKAFEASSKLNNTFKQASTGLGENLLSRGHVDEAIAVFNQLELANPWDIDRKISLASAYMEKKDYDTAKTLVKDASQIDPEHQRVKEAKAQMYLISGKINEAFALMDQLSEVGPYFASKLNDMGIKLSQAGKGKVAMALYAKAHKIVRADLKYKISMNAALALHRLGDFPLALKYLTRCEKEYGSSFEKLEKIRNALKAQLAKQLKNTPEAS